MDKNKDKLLDSALKHVAFEGWSPEVMSAAEKDLALEPGTADLYFPEGVMGMIDLFSQKTDSKMLAAMKKHDLAALKIRGKIALSIEARIMLYAKQKTVVARTVSHLSLPWNLVHATKLLWRTCDVIWRDICDDKSTDYNYYTKRSLLAGVISSSVLYFLNDDSSDHIETKQFIRRRIEDVLKIGGALSKIKNSKK